MTGAVRRQSVWRDVVASTVFLLIALSASSVWAQSVASATIHGSVKDNTGGALPGVTVTLTSAALQVKEMVNTTGAEGDYRFVDLPAGTYRVQFELPGFRSFVRDEFRLTVGFVARVDAVMEVGGLEESITVSGQSPVVDATSTSASVAFTREMLDAVPIGRDVQNIVAMTPGVTQATPDVGGSTMAQRQNIASYGVTGQPKIQIEGMTTSMGADQNSAIYFMTDTLEEVQIKTSGNDAEVSVPGISMVAVLKSGGNTFHGAYTAALQSPKLQSGNVDAALRAQGLSATSQLKSFYDLSADLGGRIVRDRLWFYIGHSRQKKTENQLGFAAGPGPDGRYLTGDETLADRETRLDQYTGKLSYQLSKSNRLVYAYQRGTKQEPQNGSGRFVPLEATRDYVNPGWIQKGELQSSPDRADVGQHRRGDDWVLNRLRRVAVLRSSRRPKPRRSRDRPGDGIPPASPKQDARSVSVRRERQLLPESTVPWAARVQNRCDGVLGSQFRRLSEQRRRKLHPAKRSDRRHIRHTRPD